MRLTVLTSIVMLGVLSACATGGGRSTPATSDARAIATAMEAASAPFVGSRKTKRFYPSACNTVKLIKPADQVGFASSKDAEAAGFTRDVYSTDCK